MENLYPVYPIPSYKDGGIHIKKKNRGKFTAAAKRAKCKPNFKEEGKFC